MSHLRKFYILDANGYPIHAISASIPVMKVALTDAAGNLLKSTDQRLLVHDGDIHDRIVNDPFTQDGGTSTTLSVAASAGDTSITVASTAGLAVGNQLRIGDATGERHVSKITALPGGGVVTLDFPLDYGYAISEAVQLVSASMNVTGTLASPQSFVVQPQAGEIFHVTSLQLTMNHTAAGDNGLFGDLTALTNGVVIRRVDGTTGQTNILTVWKSGDDIAVDGGDPKYAARSSGGGTYGTNSILNVKGLSGGYFHLDGDAGDYIEVLVQDDLSTLLDFKMHAQGHFDEGVVV